MASRRETRSQLRENKDGGSGGFSEEMDKWGKVADMIGESLEYVCSMGQQERDELVMLLPDDDGDATGEVTEKDELVMLLPDDDGDVTEKDALLGEILESEDERDTEHLKHQKSAPTEVEEQMEHTKESKQSYENGSDRPKRFILLSRSIKKAKARASEKTNNASDRPTPVTVRNLDFSKYVSPTGSSSQSSSAESSSKLESALPMGLESPKVAGIDKMTESELRDDAILSPIFKGRIKRARKKSQESFGEENGEVHKQRRNDAGNNVKLQLDSNGSMSEKFKESDYVVEHDEATDVNTSENDSPIHNLLNGNQNQKNEINKEKSALATWKAFETKNFSESHDIVEQNATTDVDSALQGSPIHQMVNDNHSKKNEMNNENIGKACNKIPQKINDDSDCVTANSAVPGNLVEHNETSIRKAVIDKIVNWNDFHNINLISQNVSSVEECINTMEENTEAYKFENVIKKVNIVKEVVLGVEDIQKYFTAVKKIKGEYAVQEQPPLITVSSGRREDGFGLKATQMKPNSSRSARVENKSGMSGLAKVENYLNSRIRTRSKEQDVPTDNINIEVDDSSDDFEKEEEAKDTAWNPGSKKRKRGRPSKLSDVFEKEDAKDTEWHPDSKERKRSRPSKLSDEKSKDPSGEETKKPRGGSKRKLLSRAELHQRLDDSPSEEEIKKLQVSQQTKGKGLGGKNGRGKGVGKGKGKEEKNNNVGREKMMSNENNNPANVASTSTKSFGGDGFSNQEVESSEADEIKIIGVVPSPASTSLSDGRRESNYGLSKQEQLFVHPSVLPGSSQEAGDSMSAIHVKREATGECPMCQGEFWMKELQKHAARCDGGSS